MLEKFTPHAKKLANFVYSKCSNDLGSMLIGTTIVGWLASSGAQIIGIATNKKYSNEQKSFMIPQELGDAAINIGSFFLITTPLKKFATKLAKTGKLIPKEVITQIINNGDKNRVGKLNFDVTKQSYFEPVSKSYNSFHNFLTTSAAVVGGIVSSNIVTPILRNKYASITQSKIKVNLDNKTIKSYDPNNKFNPINVQKRNTLFNIMRSTGVTI